MLFKKTLVLSDVNGGNEKAVASFEKEDGDIVGQIKLYNFHSEPSGILSLGLKEDERVVKAGITRIANSKYSFRFNTPLNLEEFSCAVININHGEVKPILHGSTQNTKISDQILAQAVLEMEGAKDMEQCKKVLDDNKIELEDQQCIEQEIDDNMRKTDCQEKCSSCKYRYAFFSKEEQQEDDRETFYDSISEDIDKLFSAHQEEEFLSQIIPFSKWVKIENDENDDYYVLGLIYENDNVKYICYGVPGIYSENPPRELRGYAEWLPLDSTKEKEYGYWLTYQDADSGENVKANFTVV